MRILVDTHALLWAAAGSGRLSPRARDVMEDPANDLVFSAASAYVIAVKAAKGHLQLPEDAATWLATRLPAFGLSPLAISVEHAAAAVALPPIHADPWDRVLVAQARIEDIPILTADSIISRYEVTTIW